MIFERERKDVLEYVSFLNQNHVDAVIVSDIGLILEIHEKFPDLAIHVSTQAHTFSVAQMEFLKSIGATRVVLDREMSLDEIKRLPNFLEKEVFIHGALCVSYSGRCLMSALNEVRSGNRGTCAQYCRMKYHLYKNNELVKTCGDYLLSTKELNTSSLTSKLLESNITSFKIEGRMKSPQYVGFITKFYRKIIDGYQKNKTIHIEKEDEKKLETLFQRGFTKGYLFSSKDIMNFKAPNHQGIFLGKVIGFTKDKIKILLSEDIHQEDGIKFVPSDKGMIVNFLYDEKGALVSSQKKGSVILVDNKVGIKEKEVVRKTLSKLLMDELSIKLEKTIPITMKVFIEEGDFAISVTDGKNKCSINRSICEIAKNRATTKEEVSKQMSKLGGTSFVLQKLEIQMDSNLFIPVSKMNEIRRDVVNLLAKKRGYYEEI